MARGNSQEGDKSSRGTYEGECSAVSSNAPFESREMSWVEGLARVSGAWAGIAHIDCRPAGGFRSGLSAAELKRTYRPSRSSKAWWLSSFATLPSAATESMWYAAGKPAARAFAGVAQKNLCAVVLYGGIATIGPSRLTTRCFSNSDAAVHLPPRARCKALTRKSQFRGALEPPPPPPPHTVEHPAERRSRIKTVTRGSACSP